MRATSVTVMAFSLCATVALAQSPNLSAIRQQARAGQYEQAWTALQQLPPTPESSRTGVDISLQAGRIDRALSSYERLVAATGRPDVQTLARISRAVLERDRHDQDALVRAESCGALLRASNTSCKADLEQMARDQNAPANARLSAAAALAEKDQGGVSLLQQVAQSLGGHNQAAIAEAAVDWPASVAVPLLKTLLASPFPEIQYLAAQRLGDFDTGAARELLKGVLSQQGFSPAKSAARFSLARLGDREQLRAMADGLPLFEGADLYRAGCALAAAGDSGGLRALEEAMRTDDPVIRLDAAAAMARWSNDKARPVIEEALKNGTPKERAYALLVVARLGWLPSNDMWRLLQHANAVVRTRAAAICMRAASGASVSTSSRLTM